MTTGLEWSKARRGKGTQPGWTEQVIELSVFLFLIVPSMVLSFFAVKQGRLSFIVVASSTILRDVALVSLVLFFIWRNCEPLDRIGWTFKEGRKEFALGIGLFLPFSYGTVLVESVLRRLGLSGPLKPLPSFLTARGVPEFLLAIALVMVVALAEETIFRGYLMLRFRTIFPSPVATVLVSAAVFSLGHGYEGSAGVLTVGVMGVLLAAVYIWRGSLVAPIVMHFLQDFVGIILLPLFGVR